MRDLQRILAIAILFTQPLEVICQSTKGASSSQSADPASSAQAAAAESSAVGIPPKLYEKWRKYGQWDYKQQGFEYRDFTQFNFGATGNAAGLDQKSVLALARASKPTREDVNSLDDPELVANFTRDADDLDKLRAMAEKDAHVTRIATDFTFLEGNTKWPREDVGFSDARWNDYRSAFKTLSLPEEIVRTKDFPGAIFFIARVKGLCTGGSSAGYVYSTKPLTPTVKSPKEALDAEARKNSDKHYAYVFKPLKVNWYAFYQVDW